MQTTPTRSKDESQVAPSATAHGWDYGPARVTTTVEIAERQDLFIAGKSVSPKSRRFMDTVNPATGEILARIPCAGPRDVDAAVAAAAAAQPKWASLHPASRRRFLFRLARRLRDLAREFAVLETMDGGRPIRVTLADDLPLATRQFLYHAGWCDKLAYAAASPRRAGADRNRSGSAACSFPPIGRSSPLRASLPRRIACGNTCIVKPSEATSLSALRLAQIIQELEMPPGVVNVLTGEAATGEHLVDHADVKKVVFTGTNEVGRAVARTCAAAGKPYALQLHDTTNHVVFADAAVNQAVDGIVDAMSTGQSPAGGAASRILVEESVLDSFTARLTRRLGSVRVADPLDRNTDLGPRVSEDALAKVRKQIDEARSEGIAVDEGVFAEGTPDAGFWCLPVVMKGVQPSHSIAQAPIAGPVLAVMSFRTPAEAIERVNHARGGLAAGIWSDKGAKVLALARGLRAGVVWCNGAGRLDAASPFGGRGAAGGSRVGGPAGLREYMEQ